MDREIVTRLFQGLDREVVDVDDSRHSAQVVKEESQLVIGAIEAHADRPFEVETTILEGPRREPRQPETATLRQLLGPFDQIVGFSLGWQDLPQTREFHLVVSDVFLETRQIGLGGEALFEQLSYRDSADVAVLALESRALPTPDVADWIAEKCRVGPEQLYLLVAPTASLVGSVQVAARVVETGLHKMTKLGFDFQTVLAGVGTCPLAPIAADDLQAIGRTNDTVLYGGQVWYTVQAEDAAIASLIERLPSSVSRDYGTPFYELFQRYGGDFYQIDPLLFSPAEIYINNVVSGRTFHAGSRDAAMIQKVLLA